MTTPRNATREIAEEMAQLRNAMRQVASELRMNKALIQDAMARLEEMNNGHHVAPFCGLPIQAMRASHPKTKIQIQTRCLQSTAGR